MYQRRDTKTPNSGDHETFEMSQFGHIAGADGQGETDALIGGVRRSKRRRRFKFEDDSWLNEKMMTRITVCVLLTMAAVTAVVTMFDSFEQRGERCVAVTPYLGEAVAEGSSWCSDYTIMSTPMNGRKWQLNAADRARVAVIIVSYVTADDGKEVLLSLENIRKDHPHADIVVSDLGSPVKGWQDVAVEEHGVRIVHEASGKNELAGYRAGLAVVSDADAYLFMQASYVYGHGFLEPMLVRRCSIMSPAYSSVDTSSPFDSESQQAWVQDKLSRMQGGCPDGFYLPGRWTRLYSMTFAATAGAVRDLYCRGLFHSAEGDNNVPAGAQERLMGILMENYGCPGDVCTIDGISTNLPTPLQSAPTHAYKVGRWKKYHFWKLQSSDSM